MISSLKAKIFKLNAEKKKFQLESFVNKYTNENKLESIISTVDSLSSSTGASFYDYVLLHSYIREKKPKFILECGTGKSTWILADALKKNFEESGIKGKLISMESIGHYFEEACINLPEHLKEFVEIHLTDLEDYTFSIFTGNSYKSIPDYPYEFVFIDGPDDPYVGEYVSLKRPNMDFIKLIQKSTQPLTAIIDYRLPTVITYSIIFGKNKVQFLKPWNIGLLENVTVNDIVINKEGVTLMKIVKDVSSYAIKNPSWIKI